MNRLEKKLKELKIQGRKALSVFLTAGYPDARLTEMLVPELEKCGVDFFEIGLPFSDPIADGPTIQHSSEIALKRGMNWNKLLHLAKAIGKRSQAPLVLMSYANPLFCHGWETAARKLKEAGFDGVIIPDLVPEENRTVRSIFRKQGLSLIYLCAPTSSPERIRKIGRESSGFIYCVTVTGVTGARKNLPSGEIRGFLKRVKARSRLPVLLGFGISKARQIKEFRNDTDGFIIGSALIKTIAGGKNRASLIRRAKNFIIPFARENRPRGR